MKTGLGRLKHLWSTTAFSALDLCDYAETQMVEETRRGVMSMSLLLLLLIAAGLVAYAELELGNAYLYGYGLVALLAAHIYFSARSIGDIKVLHLLGITLLTVSATAFVSIAHQTSHVSGLLLANIMLLFMIVPVVPWGLREGTTVVFIIYSSLTLSIGSVIERFDTDTLWTLQFFMGAAAMISLALVARGVGVRQNDISARFDLEQAREHLFRLSNIDPLTGTWNRRYLPQAMDNLVERFGDGVRQFCFAVFDVDDFKILNDTYGHEAGDAVLVCVSEAFTTRLNDNGYFLRLGGDEFALMLVHEDPTAFIQAATTDLQSRVQDSFGDDTHGPQVNMSVGQATALLQSSASLTQLYKEADAALYEDKESRRGGRRRNRRNSMDESGSWTRPA